jgi:putative endonuclease
MRARGILGSAGETMACETLRRTGLKVLERNYRCELGEIDIVAGRAGLVVFCEVKTRRSDRWGAPAEAVTPVKQARIRRVAVHWLTERRLRADQVRFDVISIVIDRSGTRVDHLAGAF